MTDRDLRRTLVEAARELARRGLNRGRSGNVSVRAGAGFLITPTGIPPDEMRPKMMVGMRLSGRWSGEWHPSSEWRLHAAIYRARPEAGAVVHTHSLHASALSTLRISIPAFHYMVGVAGGVDIRCAEYATFGTLRLARAMMAALEERKACLLANHGVVAWETNLPRAVDLAEEVETLARQYGIARQMGEPIVLDRTEMSRILAKFADYGQSNKGKTGP